MILKKLYCKICNPNFKTSVRLKFCSKTCTVLFSYLTTKVQRKLKGLNCLYLNIKKEKEKERDIKLMTKLKTKGSN